MSAKRRFEYPIEQARIRAESHIAMIARKNRGWLCKTSIPGSNPGGASNFS
jgi:hypothetical protein